MSLRSRLFLGIGATVLVSLVVTVVAGALLTRRSLEDSAVRALVRQVELIAAQRDDAPEQDADALLGRFLATDQQRLADPDADPGRAAPSRRRRRAHRSGLPASGSVDVRGQRFLYAARSTGTEAIVLLRPADRQAADWWPFVVGLALAGIVGAALAAVVAWLLSRAVARPIARVSNASGELATGSSPAPLPVEGPPEVARLAGLVQRPVRRAPALAGRGARVPPLGEPRAQDPADVDPRPRRRGSVTACSSRRGPVP